MNSHERKEVYLGDGVYASVEEGMIRLRAPKNLAREEIIYLEREVYKELVRFVDRVARWK